MIKWLFRSILFFSISFVVLSIPFQGAPLFKTLHYNFKTQTDKVLGYSEEKISEGLQVGKQFFGNLFSFSVPEIRKDKIKAKRSSVTKRHSSEKITKDDTQKLEDLLNGQIITD